MKAGVTEVEAVGTEVAASVGKVDAIDAEVTGGAEIEAIGLEVFDAVVVATVSEREAVGAVMTAEVAEIETIGVWDR